MQLQRRKKKCYKLLCLFKTIPNSTKRSALCSVPPLLVIKSHVCDYHTWSFVSSVCATRALSIYPSLLPPSQASRLLCSHRPSFLRLCDLQGHRYCESPVKKQVAWQQAVNKKQCSTLYLSRSGPSFTGLAKFVHMPVSLHVQYVGHTGKSSARRQLTYVVQCACVSSNIKVTEHFLYSSTCRTVAYQPLATCNSTTSCTEAD